MPNFSEEIKKNTENVPSSPRIKNKTQNSIKQRAIFAYLQIFIRNHTVLKKQRKIPQDRPKNTLKWF